MGKGHGFQFNCNRKRLDFEQGSDVTGGFIKTTQAAVGTVDCGGLGAILEKGRPAGMFFQTPRRRLNSCPVNAGWFLMKASMPCCLWHPGQGFLS